MNSNVKAPKAKTITMSPAFPDDADKSMVGVPQRRWDTERFVGFVSVRYSKI
ncbi:MAG: hypothetical protein ACI4B3_03555 [Prevotella sp.]